MTELLMPELPDKMSELLRVALADLELACSDPKVKINMAVWHTPAPAPDGGCTVCLAGAVMRHTLKASDSEERQPAHFSIGTGNKLLILNAARQGLWHWALAHLFSLRHLFELENAEALAERKKLDSIADLELYPIKPPPPYESDGGHEALVKYLLKAIAILEKHDL